MSCNSTIRSFSILLSVESKRYIINNVGFLQYFVFNF